MDDKIGEEYAYSKLIGSLRKAPIDDQHLFMNLIKRIAWRMDIIRGALAGEEKFIDELKRLRYLGGEMDKIYNFYNSLPNETKNKHIDNFKNIIHFIRNRHEHLWDFLYCNDNEYDHMDVQLKLSEHKGEMIKFALFFMNENNDNKLMTTSCMKCQKNL